MSKRFFYYNTSFNPDFISVWDTTQAGSASDTVVLPLLSSGVYNGTIDWGDGSTSPLSYANRQHTYASGGTYTITINGNLIQGFSFGGSGDRLKLLDVTNCGNLALTTASAFFGCSNLTWTATDSPIILTNTLQQTFRNCTNFNPVTLSCFHIFQHLNCGKIILNLRSCWNFTNKR